MPETNSALAPADTGAREPCALLFREGMSRVAGAVHVVTTDGPAGRAGFTATAVAPVTDLPASLLVCVNAAGRTARAVVTNGVLCVNTLAAGDKGLADVFAGRTRPELRDRFTIGAWGRLETGAPVLETAIAAFDCVLTEARLIATHYVMIGEIRAIRLGPSSPALVYRERAYHAL
jgi:flavin reductase